MRLLAILAEAIRVRLSTLLISVALHAVVLMLMARLPDWTPDAESSIIKVAVRQKVRPPPPPPPKVDETIPPPELVPKKVKKRTAKKIVKDGPAPPPAASAAPPPPPMGFSVDMSATVVGGSGVAVPTVQGGGNMFADPSSDALPKGKATTPQAPSVGKGKGGPPDAYQITEEPKFLTPISDRAPPYPEAAKALGLEGTVILRVYVDEEGRVPKVRIIQRLGHGCDELAVRWAKTKWRFSAAKAGDEPVGMWIKVPVRFVLER